MENPRPGGEMKSREPSEPTKSQLLPLASAWQELMTKPYFVPGIIASAGIAALYSARASKLTIRIKAMGLLPVDVPVYYIVIALLLVAGGAFAIYRMVGKPKALWLMPAVIAFTGLLTYSPLMDMLQNLFGVFSPGGGRRDGVFITFVRMVFEAGLPEEILKAIPVGLGIYIGLKLMQRLRERHPAREFAVLEPLDGILIGAASGFGFAFAETVAGYMPKTIVVQPYVLQEFLAMFKKGGVVPPFEKGMELADKIAVCYMMLVKVLGETRATFELQRILAGNEGVGLELMIPRLASEVFGHAAYAGILGYFLGLAVIKPVNRVKTIAIGLAIAVALHASWNSMSGSLLMNFVITVAGFIALAVTIIKARQMSPERSQLVASQVLASEGVRRPSPPPVAPAPVPVPASVSKAAAAARVVPAAPASITWDDDSNQRIIEIGSARIPAAVGARLWERQAPGASASRGDGVVAEVSANPNDPNVLGLKNLSTASFAVTLADGSTRELASGRSIRLEAGMTFVIGNLTATVR